MVARLALSSCVLLRPQCAAGLTPKLAPYQLARLAAALVLQRSNSRRAASTLAAASAEPQATPAAASGSAPEQQQQQQQQQQQEADERYMRLALEQAVLAEAADEVPVGAVLVSPAGEVLAAARNCSEAAGDPTAHAELLCIREAAAAQGAGGWRLLDATLYVTLEPCPMCAGALLQSRVGAVVYGARNRLLGADGSWIAMLPRQPGQQDGASSSSSGESSPVVGSSASGSDSAGEVAELEAAPPARPHPFHPNMRVRRGVLAEECAALMKSFFARRRREQAEAAAAAATGAAAAAGAIASCRAFADAFDTALQRDAPLRSAATAPLTCLGAAFSGIDLGAEPAEALFRQAYGYEPWLLAPEKGVRALIRSAVELFRPPVEAAVGGVHAALVTAVHAAERALAGSPDWQRQQLTDAALASVGAWRTEALHQLGLLLEAEQVSPEGAAFVAVRQRLASLAAVPSSLGQAAVPAPSAPEPALRKKETPEAAAPQAINTLFVGHLKKLDRYGRWSRRWFMLDRATGTLAYYKSPSEAQAHASFALKGAVLVHSVAPGTAEVQRSKQPLLFLLYPPGGTRTLILRAHSPAIKQAWLGVLAGAIAGAPADAPPTKQPPGSATVKEGGSQAPEEGGGAAAAGVGRKISTRVFPQEPAADEEGEEDDPERAEAAQQQAAEQELVEAIEMAAAERRPSPAEAALLAAVLPVVRSYVEAVAVRLQGVTHKAVSALMLLGRREALGAALLAAALLPPGTVPARLDSADAA